MGDFDARAEIKVIKVKMIHAENERQELLTELKEIKDQVNALTILGARYKGFMGAVMLIGTTLLAGAAFVYDMMKGN